MLKRILKTIFILFIGAILGFIGGFFFPHTSDFVDVTIYNESSQNIKEVRVVHEDGICLVENLGREQGKYVRFVPKGESSFHLEVEFANGKKLKGGGNYVEPGYVLYESINDNGISFGFGKIMSSTSPKRSLGTEPPH